jgi:hypothetical protein
VILSIAEMVSKILSILGNVRRSCNCFQRGLGQLEVAVRENSVIMGSVLCSRNQAELFGHVQRIIHTYIPTTPHAERGTSMTDKTIQLSTKAKMQFHIGSDYLLIEGETPCIRSCSHCFVREAKRSNEKDMRPTDKTIQLSTKDALSLLERLFT